MDELKVKEIVDYMVEHGTENTHYGNWIFGVEDDLAAFSEMSNEWLMEHYNDIYDELIGREEVAAVDEDMEKGVHLITITNIVYQASMLKMRNPSVETVYAIDNYHGLRNDFKASMYRSTIENCAIFKNILETQGIQLY